MPKFPTHLLHITINRGPNWPPMKTQFPTKIVPPDQWKLK